MSAKQKRRKRRQPILANERFATKAVVVIGITTAIFIIMQYVSFLITGAEQITLIEYYFKAVVIECGAMMLKRVVEVAAARIKKKEQININENESEENNYD
ncbi:hypothetical protein [Anaerotruncus rubiinfantis]|uniref:hypothetical protein n=1 Tax=Anaerotruncus rubiinfantis TaxID=1720200 RepID=UPI00189AD7CC|nr:hypothetical protein [Anaerotruncus rubiinfantis]